MEHHERVLTRLLAAGEAVAAGDAAPSHLVSEADAAHNALDGAHAEWQRLCWEMFLDVDYAAELFLPDDAVEPQVARRQAVVSAAAPYLALIHAALLHQP